MLGNMHAWVIYLCGPPQDIKHTVNFALVTRPLVINTSEESRELLEVTRAVRRMQVWFLMPRFSLETRYRLDTHVRITYPALIRTWVVYPTI